MLAMKIVAQKRTAREGDGAMKIVGNRTTGTDSTEGKVTVKEKQTGNSCNSARQEETGRPELVLWYL